MPDLKADLLKELLATFQTEAVEHLQTLNQALLELERTTQTEDAAAQARRKELVQNAFRAAHSLKGAARAVSLSDIEQLAHGMENVLHSARSGKLELKPVICDVLYDVLDAIQNLLKSQPIDVAPLLQRLTAAATDVSATPVPVPTPVSVPDAPAVSSGNGTAEKAPPPVNLATPVKTTGGEPPKPDVHDTPTDEMIRVAVSKLDDLMAQVGELLVSKMGAEQHLTDLQDLRRQLTHWPRTWREIKSLMPHVTGDGRQQLAAILTRHDEHMQALAREVNMLYQSMNRDTLRLGMVTTNLQASARRMRMVPFQTIVFGLQRAVRDAARSEGRQAELTIKGAEVELDKKVLEMLKDPLLHLLRNAVAHGIENEADRVAQGKPVVGQITVAVQQRGGEVRVSVSDDGRGFNLDALRSAAEAHGSPAITDNASASEIINLAFLPGVSTAQQVTTLAGRGVGLDVVKRCLEAIQGRILVDSTPGKGTTIQLLVPTSVTMTRGLLVRVGTEEYMLPLLAVEKIIELHADSIFTIEGQPAVNIDGKPLPLASLATILKRAQPEHKKAEKLPAVIICVAEQRLVLVVDEIVTEQELAVMPLGKLLRRVRNVTGAALLGDGRPVIILNTADLVKVAKAAEVRHIPLRKRAAEDVKPIPHILVVDDSITTRTLEKNILEAAGFHVYTATDGTGAIRQLGEHPVDLVVTDVQMPQMDGISLTRHLRDSIEFNNLPVILVTSLETREDREQGMMAGANAYIVKRGFDQAELLATIQQLL
ncbi:MAG: hybrid sensor histidine kinase/response regulator [Anaerolineae bacterium]|nr:hybrid sensor histidine kinase/response regulator [Anaerolineae bacterium]